MTRRGTSAIVSLRQQQTNDADVSYLPILLTKGGALRGGPLLAVVVQILNALWSLAGYRSFFGGAGPIQ